MLIKASDRVTIDGFLALNLFKTLGETASLKAYLETVRSASGREGELPFPHDPAKAIRFFWNGDKECRALSTVEISRVLNRDPQKPPTLEPVTAEIQGNPEALQKFLVGESHEQLAFTNNPLFLIRVGGAGPQVAMAWEGRSGCKYGRSKAEVLEFLSTHPEGKSLFLDLMARISYQKSIETFTDLSDFLDEDVRHLDLVIDQAALVSGYLFDVQIFGETIAKKKEWFFELNPDSYATVDFNLYPVEDERPRPAALSIASAKASLKSALVHIAKFAENQTLDSEASYFHQVLKKVDEIPQDLPPLFKLSRIPAEAYALYRAALAADVFAGVASWNDVQIDKTETYRTVSNELCLALLNAVCASCNTALHH